MNFNSIGPGVCVGVGSVVSWAFFLAPNGEFTVGNADRWWKICPARLFQLRGGVGNCSDKCVVWKRLRLGRTCFKTGLYHLGARNTMATDINLN